VSATESNDFAGRIDAVEEAYEFMLAYAAQGLTADAASNSGGQLRDYLTRASAALSGLADVLRAIVRDRGLQPAEHYGTFADMLERDARHARASIELVLAQPAISSQLVDNLNASVHLRALLTDLFLVDELLKQQVTDRP
jgi:hypothetical protein